MIAILALENGQIFEGIAIGAIDLNRDQNRDQNIDYTCGELVFNTSMTGYQEIISDPSYCEQIILFTTPHIGNYGLNIQDVECDKVWSKGIVIKSLSQVDSNWRSTNSLNLYLKQNNLIGIANVDTRAITVILRDQGSQRCCIYLVRDNDNNDNNHNSDLIKSKAIELARMHPSLNNLDLAKVVSTKEAYQWTEDVWTIKTDSTVVPALELGSTRLDHESDYSAYTAKFHAAKFHIVVYDFGVKQQILRLLVKRHCKVTVVPAQTSLQEVLALKPDGVLLSNGPGDPAACSYAIEVTKELIKLKMPIFGICLGFQILSLALGLKTQKMKFGHHGANHPVKDFLTDRVFITSQNHGFMAVEPQKVDNNEITITHRSLFDNTIQGLMHISLPIIGFQGHPEASPGPNDIEYLFDNFITNIAAHKSNSNIVETELKES